MFQDTKNQTACWPAHGMLTCLFFAIEQATCTREKMNEGVESLLSNVRTTDATDRAIAYSLGLGSWMLLCGFGFSV